MVSFLGRRDRTRARTWATSGVVLAALGGCSAPPVERVTAETEALVWPQHSTWTIDRGAAKTHRIVAYGDSIFAGFQGDPWNVSRRSAPYVAGEYLATSSNANVEVVRRTISGGLASEVAALVNTERSYMQDPSTRAVYFEMCGNDYLSARGAFDPAHGSCDHGKLESALRTCVTNTELAMRAINESARTAKAKVVANLYYPGYDADDGDTFCIDAVTGQHANLQKTLLPWIARSNWKTCDLARRNGFACVDAFADFMAADWDENGDGRIDSDAIRFDPNESEEAYVHKIVVTLRSTLRDANKKSIAPSVSATYLFTDNTHPLGYLGAIPSGSTGSSPPDFAPASLLASGANPQWNTHGHERLGWALFQAGPASLR